jgi:hypothetical protein
MSGRLRSYYPESSIEKGLYTNGGELMTTDYEEYVGFYHKYTTGEIFSLHEYTSFSQKLITFEEAKNVINLNNNIKNSNSPIHEIITPKLEDFNSKESWNRYFVKKVNDVKWGIKEISKEKRDDIVSNKKNSMDSFLFTTMELPWKLTGILRDLKRSGVNYSGVYDTNLRTIQNANKDFIGITNILKDPLQYTIYSKWYTKFIQQ